jgi:hypothetical protein
MNRRTLTTTAPLGLAIAVTIPKAGFAQSNPLIGTWKFNFAKSTFSPGPLPRSATITFQAEGQGLTDTFDVIDARGNPTKTSRVIYDDGKSYPVT